jgi:hypothetical protein
MLQRLGEWIGRGEQRGHDADRSRGQRDHVDILRRTVDQPEQVERRAADHHERDLGLLGSQQLSDSQERGFEHVGQLAHDQCYYRLSILAR